MKARFKPLLSSAAIALACCAMSTPASAAAINEIFSLGGGVFAQDHIYRVDLSTSTVTDLGFSGVGFPTNLAMSPDRTLYYMNPFEGTAGPGHRLFKATLNATNTALVGAPTFVRDLPTVGFGIIDGFTVGPNGDLYMTGYGQSAIYRYNITSNVFTTEVHLTGGGEFRSDLAFDPVTGRLIGLGIEPGSSDRTLFQIDLSLLTDGVDNAYAWTYFGGAASAWSTKKLDTGSELGANPDGLAFNPTNGDLFMSGDGTGIYAYDRLTAVRGALIPGTGDGFLNGLGFDLAFQTRVTVIGSVPEPGSLALMLVGFGALVGRIRRKRSC